MTDQPTTTLAWASDIHLDHAGPDRTMAFIDRVRTCGASALLLGGDIATADSIDQSLIQITEMVEMPVYFVLGNHDFYRGSIAAVRENLERLNLPDLHWLAQSGPQELAPGVTLCGNGGWGDARLGDFAGSDVILTDYVIIAELKRVFNRHQFKGEFGSGTDLERELKRLGREAADQLAPQLTTAAQTSRQVLVLTHVPPFCEACWHKGQISSDHWLPGFTCGAVGEILTEAAAAHPDCEFTILCGHTHGGGQAQIAPNLIVHTQAAEYGQPDFQLVEASPNQMSLDV